MRIKINRDLCTGVGFCERCLNRLFIYPTVLKRNCLDIVDDKQDEVTIELRSGASGVLYTLNDQYRAILASESYSGFSDLVVPDRDPRN